MNRPKLAPANDDGLYPYVVTTRTPWDVGRDVKGRIEWATSLAEAKRRYGFTRQAHARVEVRRATTADMEAHA